MLLCLTMVLPSTSVFAAGKSSSQNQLQLVIDLKGSGRKYLWNDSWDLFCNFPLKTKLFGVGTDTICVAVVYTYYKRGFEEVPENTGMLRRNSCVEKEMQEET